MECLDLHRALADTQRALGVLQAMVAQQGTINVWELPPKIEELAIDDGLGDVSDHPF